MANTIDKVVKVSVSTTAQDIDCGYKKFMIENLATGTVYFKEKDGVDCTASNGFAIPAATFVDTVFRAKTLSIVGEGDADVRIIFFEEC